VELANDLFDALRTRFDERELVELTSAIAWENYRARFNHAFGCEAEGFSEGAFCPLPR
jgi:alkylhydroperoxidase family enzyme